MFLPDGTRPTAGRAEDLMTTMLMERLETGDVIEIARNGEHVTALVLLASEEAVILDVCDGSIPFVLERDEVVDYRKFEPAA
jgi:hypothetical protein